MATYQTFQAIGEREDLSDVIYMITPTETPMMSSIGKGKATAVFHEWQTDALAAAAHNKAVEGADGSDITATPTTRVGNYCQISTKTVKVAGTLEAVDKAGRKSEMAYQMAKVGKEIKRDMELTLVSNETASAGNASTARAAGGIQAWLASNKDLGSGGTAGASGTTARGNGTDRAFTETILKNVIKQTYNSGGDPKVILVPATQKVTLSGFSGIAAQRYLAPSDEPTTIIGAADVYMSDFGTMSVVPNRLMNTATESDDGEIALVVDPEMLSVAYLRPFQTVDLAKTGDAEKKQLLAEWTLEVRNEAAHGIAGDLTE
tara:strand:+ start:14280 stop:15233 length:954 start_codon:yes stop_codon:yes gene_type:complete